MKKLLAVLGSLAVVSSSTVSLVSCGKSNDTTITVGYVDNGKDKSEKSLMEQTKVLFDQQYGDLGFTVKLKAYEDENKIPEQIFSVANGKDIPDVYAPTVDYMGRLASAGYIMALDGKNSAWSDGAPILKDLKYNDEGKNEAQALIDKYFSADSTEEVTDAVNKDLWNHWLPYAIETSKYQSQNTSHPDDHAVQYGITKNLGVGGGSAIVNTSDEGGFKEMFSDLGLINEEAEGFDFIKDAKVSINKLVDYMSKNEDKIFTLFDRGMWWMYPVYANAFATVTNKVIKSADIGLNWHNDAQPNLKAGESRKTEFSSIFGNKLFEKSTKEVIGKWFELFGQQSINAKKILDKQVAGETATADQKYDNLFDPNANAGVQTNLINHSSAAGINYEPGSYFDMLKGFKLFSNMEYMPLNTVKLFDDKDTGVDVDAYEKAGLNTWLTPAGSGQVVFNSSIMTNGGIKKAEAAMKFVELEFGLQKDGTWTGDGGVRNLENQFASAGDIPTQVAILNEKNTIADKYQKAMKTKVQVKFDRAADEVKGWKAEMSRKFGDEAKGEKAEKAAILKLESTSINLAANLYKEGGKALSLAPNRSAFDEADKDDYHGNQAMKPSLLKYLGTDKDISKLTHDGLVELSKQFATDLMLALANFDIQQSNEQK